ncbi:MAG: UDP-N-acetylglucosamine 2-epimerase (non-hydrolyzing) [Euryarchaeota archaeon]|nr:UDP-N-acetylglucosamine 2-epimerase (non-hydrolyzing) [Euryarchaeota archaeon]
MKVLSVVGARPQFIKASAVSPHIRKSCREVLVHTGQHYDYAMSGVFFEGLNLPDPDYNLNAGSGGHGQQTGRILSRLEKVAVSEKPDIILIYGDTNSTLAGALCAAKLHIPVAHVEAGLRSFNRTMPEEINRVVADHVSDMLFCPTEGAVRNLAAEGVTRGVHMVGDVMYDTALKYGNAKSRALGRLGLRRGAYHLLTVHRPANTDVRESLGSIFTALSGEDVVFPAHPRTVKMMRRFGLKAPKGMRVIEPVGYVEMLSLIKNAKALVTDSGGAQKEAYFFRVPCITLREDTEWLETVEDGWNVLVGSDGKKIRAALENFRPKGKQTARFGDGHAGEKIAKLVCA